jgi:septal ring-binding cell division protein DamX
VATIQPATASPPPPRDDPVTTRFEALSDPLEIRLLATKEWLSKTPGNVFSIQLLGSNDLNLLRNYIDRLQKSVEPEKIFVYRTQTNSGPSVTLLYGTFSSRADALKALDLLPSELRLNRPYIRTVDGVRLEIGLSASAS